MASSHELVLTTLLGGPPLSGFRARALLRRLQAVAPQVSAVAARHVHLISSDAPLDGVTADSLTRLLTYGEPYAGAGPGQGQGGAPEDNPGKSYPVVVGPRLGTISPWASKATDIVHNCG
ncbi:MAG: hypothetical protein Q4P32_07910, partial [Micrococcales bacterium]|nr:hypothetical protein [Micrococcales bacterium]